MNKSTKIKTKDERLIETYRPKQRTFQKRRDDNYFKILWRLILLNSISFSLIIIFLTNGIKSINSDQLSLSGTERVSSKEIIKASKIDFPARLLLINPKSIKKNLIREFSFKGVTINRQLIPPKLDIKVEERVPIALASKKGHKGIEKGMIDQHAYWIPFSPSRNGLIKLETNVIIEGWMESHQKQIELILKNRDKLGSTLKKIQISPNGEISLQTKAFKKIELGMNSSLLKKQLQTLFHLAQKLPSGFQNQTVSSLDMRDPSKPEFNLSNPSQ